MLKLLFFEYGAYQIDQLLIIHWQHFNMG